MSMQQVDLTDEERQILLAYKALKGIKANKDALKELIKEKKYLVDKLKEIGEK